MTRIADEFAGIAARAREIEAAEATPEVRTASGSNLDWVGERMAIKRKDGEGDYEYRKRLLEAAG